MTNTVATIPKQGSLKDLLTGTEMKKQFANALPRHLSVDRFVRVALTALTRTPGLQDCTPASFFKCLLDLSAMGLEPDGRRAHLLPYQNRSKEVTECTLIVDYKGIVELVRRDADVVDVQALTIRERDQAYVENGVIHHRYNPLETRGEVKAVYTKIVWSGGHVSYGEPMGWDEAEVVRNDTPAWKAYRKYGKEGPWNTHPIEMWKKTAVRRDSKMWPLSPEIRDAVEKDDDQFKTIETVTVSNVSGLVPAAEPPAMLPPPETSPIDVSPAETAPPPEAPQPTRKKKASASATYEDYQGMIRKARSVPKVQEYLDYAKENPAITDEQYANLANEADVRTKHLQGET